MRIDTLGVEAFVAIAETGRFTRAAAALHITQTAQRRNRSSSSCGGPRGAAEQDSDRRFRFPAVAPPGHSVMLDKTPVRAATNGLLAKARVLTLDTYESMVQSGRYLTVPAGRE